MAKSTIATESGTAMAIIVVDDLLFPVKTINHIIDLAKTLMVHNGN